MNILRVIGTMNPRWGGPVEGVRQMCGALAALGHHNEIGCLDAPDSPWLGDLSLPCPVVGLGPSLGKYGYTRRLGAWLRARAHRFDCVIVHGAWQYQGLGTWRALRGLGVPYFVYTHGGLESWSLGTYRLKALKKRAYWRLIEHRVMRDARAVLFTSRDEWTVSGQSFRPFCCQGALVEYGTAGPVGHLGHQSSAFLERFPELRGERFLAYLGRLHPHKGCDLLIDAFAAVAAADPRLRLVMIGPDQLGWQTDLERQAVRLGVDRRVIFTGMLTGDLKWGALHSAEAFCLPSHFENFGISVVEALACGRPVLLSNKVSICREIEADGAAIVGADDAEGIGEVLRRWIALPPERREAMGAQARTCFANRYHVARAAQNLVETLQSLGARSSPVREPASVPIPLTLPSAVA